jgi:hypothetical protein
MAATYFIDLDGCIFRHGTNDLLPGAADLLKTIIDDGGEIVFTTYRGNVNFKGHRVYSEDGAMDGVRSLTVPYKTILFDVDSPRIVINDSGAYAINHVKNAPWTTEDLETVVINED